MKKFILSVALTAALATPATACDLCAIYSANQARGDIGKGLFFGMAEQFTHFGTLQVDGHRVHNEVGQYLDSSVSQAFVGYNFNDRVGLQLNVPVIYRSFKRPEGFEIDRGTESGVGDVSLIGHFQVYRRQTKRFTFSWSILGGVKFPTGSTDRLKEELNEVEVPGAPESGIHGHDLTLGSGSVDGIVGTGIFLRSHRFFLTAGAQYTIRSKGDLDYRFADDLTWLGGPGYFVVLKDEYTIALALNVSGEHKERDRFRGERAEDTGVTAVYLGPQISFTWKDKLSAEVGVDLPVSIDNTALQSIPDYRVRAGLTWHF
ncbi:MAG: hypothetical protein DME26_11965 [Verrucomicrobia bacterium]|nr:MAG: hypothetical protein DME26_11965 [Verrucomicrobiota bacterium]